MTDINDMASKAIDSVKKYISDKISEIDVKLMSITKRIDSINIPEATDYEKVSGMISGAIEDYKKSLPEIKNGLDGKDGIDGKDADINEIKSFIESEVSKIPSPENGKDGLDGKDGIDGKDADLSEIKSYIDSIFSNINVPVDGRDGRDGRDAVEMEILPIIEEEKSYPRGTYAKHDGGLWHAYKNTSGMMGWECMVDGISGIEIDSLNQRDIKVSIKTSSGKLTEKILNFPVVLDRGVYSEKESYEKGDGLTYAGSYWIVQKDDPQGKPGSSDDYRLSVKRGRNASESVKIEKPKTVKVGV